MQDLIDMLVTAAQETGREITSDLSGLREYARQRAAHLALIIGQPGYATALRAERNSVALRAGILAVDAADATDMRFLGIIEGALGVGARVLSGGLV